jgi:alanine dehydrogenase
MLYLTEDDVRRFLPMRECIGLMRTAFEQLGAGTALNHPRRRLVIRSTHAALNYMTGGNNQYFGAKVYSTHAKHGAFFSFLLYRSEDARPLAFFEGNYLGQIRTGAATGLATSLLARKDSKAAAIIGSGFQARTQLEAVAAVMPLESVRVWSRTAEKRNAFAAECATGLGLKVEAVETAEQAVRGADIITTATNAGEPVISSEWVSPGAHVNAVGSNLAKRREIPTELVQRAGLIAVDSLEQARMESGDLLLGLQEDQWARVIELQEVVAGRAGRSGEQEITLFKSNGLALEDVVAAGYVYERAVEAGVGKLLYS